MADTDDEKAPRSKEEEAKRVNITAIVFVVLCAAHYEPVERLDDMLVGVFESLDSAKHGAADHAAKRGLVDIADLDWTRVDGGWSRDYGTSEDPVCYVRYRVLQRIV